MERANCEYPIKAISLVLPARRVWVEKSPGFQALFKHLEAGPNKAPLLKKAAEIASMGVRTFTRKFKNLIGLSWGGFRMEWRLGNAWMLLSEGRMTVREAREAVGRTSGSSFARDFQDRFEVSPGEVLVAARRRNREASKAGKGRRYRGRPALRSL